MYIITLKKNLSKIKNECTRVLTTFKLEGEVTSLSESSQGVLEDEQR